MIDAHSSRVESSNLVKVAFVRLFASMVMMTLLAGGLSSAEPTQSIASMADGGGFRGVPTKHLGDAHTIETEVVHLFHRSTPSEGTENVERRESRVTQ